jgi:hypothetical protein
MLMSIDFFKKKVEPQKQLGKDFDYALFLYKKEREAKDGKQAADPTNS